MTKQIFKSRYGLIKGSSYAELAPIARKEHQTIQKLTKRQPYIRSKYFNKDKIFTSIFWEHLAQKGRKEKSKRLKYYSCAIDLLRNTTDEPETIFSYDNPNLLLHRFLGQTKEGHLYFVQVKQDKRSGRKDFMSVFPKGSK